MQALLKSKLLNVAFLLMVLLALTTCEKKPTNPEDVSPELPPVQSMSADLSFFKTMHNAGLNKTTLSKNNFTAAAVRVALINTTVILGSAVPASVLAIALSQHPQLKDDGKWHWIFNASQGINNFTVDFVGWIDTPAAEAVWEVYISSNTHTPELSDFLWFQGRSKIGSKEGWWLFHDDKSPDSLIDVIRVDWQIADETESKLIFTNVKASDSKFGDYLKYGIELSDRYLIYFDASENQTNTIYWNADTREGYIEWFNYNNGIKSYWDENLNDTSGPPA